MNHWYEIMLIRVSEMSHIVHFRNDVQICANEKKGRVLYLTFPIRLLIKATCSSWKQAWNDFKPISLPLNPIVLEFIFTLFVLRYALATLFVVFRHWMMIKQGVEVKVTLFHQFNFWVLYPDVSNTTGV